MASPTFAVPHQTNSDRAVDDLNAQPMEQARNIQGFWQPPHALLPQPIFSESQEKMSSVPGPTLSGSPSHGMMFPEPSRSCRRQSFQRYEKPSSLQGDADNSSSTSISWNNGFPDWARDIPSSQEYPPVSEDSAHGNPASSQGRELSNLWNHIGPGVNGEHPPSENQGFQVEYPYVAPHPPTSSSQGSVASSPYHAAFNEGANPWLAHVGSGPSGHLPVSDTRQRYSDLRQDFPTPVSRDPDRITRHPGNSGACWSHLEMIEERRADFHPSYQSNDLLSLGWSSKRLRDEIMTSKDRDTADSPSTLKGSYGLTTSDSISLSGSDDPEILVPRFQHIAPKNEKEIPNQESKRRRIVSPAQVEGRASGSAAPRRHKRRFTDAEKARIGWKRKNNTVCKACRRAKRRASPPKLGLTFHTKGLTCRDSVIAYWAHLLLHEAAPVYPRLELHLAGLKNEEWRRTFANLTIKVKFLSSEFWTPAHLLEETMYCRRFLGFQSLLSYLRRMPGFYYGPVNWTWGFSRYNLLFFGKFPVAKAIFWAAVALFP